MKIKNIAFVGIPVTDVKRARAFYEGVLGLKVSGEFGQGVWVEYDIGDGTLAIGSVGDQWKPSPDGTSVALEVDDFEAAIKNLKAAKVPFDTENVESPVCHMAVIQDPDGNKIIIHKLKSENEKGTLPMITNEVAFIAIAVSNKERARKFYQETLELKPATTGMDGAWVEYELGATTIGVGCHPAWEPSRDGTTVAFEVSDIHVVIQKLKSGGVTFEGETIETPVCWMAQFRDPDGNKLLVHQRKKK